ncbi:MAG: stage III sporulation protein AB [Clostridia bacterium]|jgi:stage III sporulation protein AB|nr:stage III sporulation protein AB [Clostridia bacterium]MDD4275410.1 stage III sporulation protein AB [Clostridia bacterium]
MQLFLIILIVGGISYVGYGLSSYYKKRYTLMSDILLFCDCLSNDIDFLHTPVKQILLNRNVQFAPELNKLLNQYKQILDNGKLLEFNQPISSIYFKREEAEMFMSLLYELGKSDSITQIATIKNFKTVFTKYHIEATEENKKYAPLALKLGVLIGILAGILLI